MIELSIVMPAFNEAANIAATVESCVRYLESRGRTGEIVVVDDGSADRTGAILEELKLATPQLIVLHNERNQGYGFSLQRGLAAAKGDLIATIDSDGQFDINDLDEFYKLLQANCQAVTGYRIKKQDSRGKVFADRSLNLLMRAAFGMSLKDTNCALKLYRRDAVQAVTIEAMGFATPTELMVKLAATGHAINEAPVSHRHRTGGASALKPWQTALKMMLFLIYLRLKLTLYRKAIIRML